MEVESEKFRYIYILNFLLFKSYIVPFHPITKCITDTKSNRKIFLQMAIKTLGCTQTKCVDSKNIGIRPISSGNENKFTAKVPKKLVVFLRNLSTFYDRDNRWLPMLVLAEGRGGDAYNSFYASCHQPDQLRILNQSV